MVTVRSVRATVAQAGHGADPVGETGTPSRAAQPRRGIAAATGTFVATAIPRRGGRPDVGTGFFGQVVLGGVRTPVVARNDVIGVVRRLSRVPRAECCW